MRCDIVEHPLKYLLVPTSPPPLPLPRSDVICEYPLKDMLDFHLARGAEATILVTKVNGSRHWCGCGWMCGGVEGGQPAVP